MNSELKDPELDAVLEDQQRDTELDSLLELEKIYLELSNINATLDNLLELDEKNLRKLESIKQINSIKKFFKTLNSLLDRPTLNRRQFFIALNKFSSSLVKLNKLSKKINLTNYFKYLFEIFQTIKHENHIVLLQPRLQSINSIEA